MTEISRDPMRRGLRALTHGVYVLGVHHEGRDDYLIVSLVTQCSVQPPRVALAVSVNARILPALRATGGATLGILDVLQLPAVRRYGAPGGVKHVPVNVARTSSNHPIPPEASFALELAIYWEQMAGDHVLFIADVVSANVDLILHSDRANVDSVNTNGVDVKNANADSASVNSANADSASVNSANASAEAKFTALTLDQSGFPYAG